MIPPRGTPRILIRACDAERGRNANQYSLAFRDVGHRGWGAESEHSYKSKLREGRPRVLFTPLTSPLTSSCKHAAAVSQPPISASERVRPRHHGLMAPNTKPRTTATASCRMPDLWKSTASLTPVAILVAASRRIGRLLIIPSYPRATLQLSRVLRRTSRGAKGVKLPPASPREHVI